MHMCNTQYLFFKMSTLKISTNYPNAGIHAFSHWPLAMGIYSDMLQSGEKCVPMTPVLIAAV